MDYLSHDMRALRSAAMTSRAWLAAARPHLFRYIHVMSNGQMQRLLCALQCSPIISDYIQTIRIGDKKSFRGTPAINFLVGLAGLSHPTYRLRVLELYGVYESFDSTTIKKLSHLASVVSLTLANCYLRSDELCALSSLFPNLVHVKVENCSNMLSVHDKRMALPQLHNIGLTSLTIDDRGILQDGLVSLLDYIISSQSRRTLRSVKFMIGEDGIQPAGEFLRAMGERLEYLEFGYWQNMDRIVEIIASTFYSSSTKPYHPYAPLRNNGTR